ncbi:MAG TPA: endo alpha-1,4 polygalactosaminidase, partial [Polyangiales bacterium]|nr:endo alpha-1,4 polygalactosaminidase [Polyangiales bacterium]
AFGLKNDLEEISALLDVSDFAVNEECFEYDECDALSAFVRAGKAVFHVEYTEGDLNAKAQEICPDANRLNFDTLIKHLDLDPPRKACR